MLGACGVSNNSRGVLNNKAVYTAESVACDWAGAVMRKLTEKRRKNIYVTDTVGYRVACTRLKRYNKAVYTAESVASDWAGAVMRKLPEKRRKNKCVTDRPTNQPTNQQSARN